MRSRLLLFTTFSLLCFGLTATAQETNEQISFLQEETLGAPHQQEAELVTAEAKQQYIEQHLTSSIEAEKMAKQQLAAAQATFDSAKVTRQEAEQASKHASALIERIEEHILCLTVLTSPFISSVL